MSLPVVTLDDRRFQDIVDEAKRLIPQYCPEWSDHNVSDPGVALVELFAWMTEMIIYRLNQVPDRLYVKFLELAGVELFSASPAAADLLFRLTAPQDDPVLVPAGTQVATLEDGEEPLVFATDEVAHVLPARATACLVQTGGRFEDRWEDLRREATPVPLFETLQPGDAFYVGFEQALPGMLLRLDVRTGPEGAGVDPDRAPRVWEAWDGADWRPVRVLADTSRGFNVDGAVELLLPHRHEALSLGGTRAHWLRCKLVEPGPEQPAYTSAPVLDSLAVTTIGIAVAAHHAEPAPAERLGTSSGLPGQVFEVRRRPVLPRRAGETVRVVPRPGDRADGDGVDGAEQAWSEVAGFADTDATSRVFTWSGATGEIRFGPRVVDRQGLVHQHGAVPAIDADVVVTGYRYGGGRRGNVGAGRLKQLRTSVPYVARVDNLDPATGGVDAETIDNARVRGPMTIRGGGRAVTAVDFERLTLDAVRDVARARCLPPASPGGPARLLVVPRVDVRPDRLELDDLAVPVELEERIKATLEPRRLLTVRVQIGTPRYQGIQIAAEVRASAGAGPQHVREAAEQALYRFVNPVAGGPDGSGWPFDRGLTSFDVQAVLRSVAGVVDVTAVRFLRVDLRHPEVLEQVDERVPLPPEALFLSFQHRVLVSR